MGWCCFEVCVSGVVWFGWLVSGVSKKVCVGGGGGEKNEKKKK